MAGSMQGPQRSHHRNGVIAGINVTPLVDVTLVLLIIFIVTAKIVVAPAVPLELPKASTGTQVQVIFSVLLPKDGTMFVDGAPVASHQALVARAQKAREAHDELRAVVQADGAVSHRQVMAVLDSLRRAGIHRIAFGALPEEASQP